MKIALVAAKAKIYGKADLYLDGGAAIPVDLYNASTLYKQVAWSSGFLKPGNHTLVIRYTGTKNAAATGTAINLDGLDVIGTLR